MNKPSGLLAKSICWLSLLLAIVPAAMVPAAAMAQAPYPTARDAYVNDFAGRLAPNEAEAIRSLLRQARDETGVEATVVVVDSIHDYPTGDATIESFATHLFNAWGVGDAERNDGVLFLVALGDRKVRIEVGDGYGQYNSALMKRILDVHVLPRFKAGRIADGISAGVGATLAELADWQPPTAVVPVSKALPATSPPHWRTRKSRPVWPWVAAGLVLAGAALVSGRFAVRYRRRRCPHCHTFMRRLDESEEDAFLIPEQETEETLGSVDYDVWKCDGCQHTMTTAWRSWFSSYKTCPSCGYRTLVEHAYVVSQPTYDSSGRKTIESSCRSCDFEQRREIVMPRLTRSSSSSAAAYSSFSSGSSSVSSFSSSSSSSSSFGGGGSSGGGASGSW